MPAISPHYFTPAQVRALSKWAFSGSLLSFLGSAIMVVLILLRPRSSSNAWRNSGAACWLLLLALSDCGSSLCILIAAGWRIADSNIEHFSTFCLAQVCFLWVITPCSRSENSPCLTALASQGALCMPHSTPLGTLCMPHCTCLAGCPNSIILLPKHLLCGAYFNKCMPPECCCDAHCCSLRPRPFLQTLTLTYHYYHCYLLLPTAHCLLPTACLLPTIHDSLLTVHHSLVTGHWSLLQLWLAYLLLTNHKSQITNHKSQITNHKSQITNHKSRFTNHESRITNHEPRTTNHESQITTCHSPLTTYFPLISGCQALHHLLLTIYYSLLTTHYLPPTTYYSLPTD